MNFNIEKSKQKSFVLEDSDYQDTDAREKKYFQQNTRIQVLWF